MDDTLQAQEAPEVSRQQETDAELRAEEAALQVDERELTRQALWERKLLDFSLRNNLLNTRLGKRAVQFISFGVSGMEDLLQTGENYSILPWPEERKLLEPENGIFCSTTQAAPLQEQFETDIKSHKLSTYLSATELKPVLTNLYRGARTALEENGANALFIAIGMLRWYATERSEQPRYAPILLLPVDLVRHGSSYVVRMRDEETILNVTLNEFLRQQFKLTLPTFDPLPRDASGVDVPQIFAAMRKAIEPHPRWKMLDESVLGLFSFNKFVMWNDIHTNAEKLQESPIVQSLVERRLTLPDDETPVDVREFDLSVPPAEVATPISVDSSQLEAVVESGRGKSFILYGPPGTGKSQTITNMIANALYQGRRVLFVAEKMAALQVVQKRLTQIGLAPFCLELHSNKVTKTHFLGQLQEALDVTHGRVSEDFTKRSEELFALRQQLNRHMQAMHRKGACGLSVYECIEGYESSEMRDERLEMKDSQAQPSLTSHLSSLISTLSTLTSLTDELTQLDALFRVTGHPAAHTLTGLVLNDDRREALDEMERLLKAFQASDAKLPAELAAEWEHIQAKWLLPRFFGQRSFIKAIQRYKSGLTKEDIPAFLDATSFVRDKTTVGEWLSRKGEWREWAQWFERRQSLVGRNLQPIVDYIEAGHSGEETARALARVLYKEWAVQMIDEDDELRRFNGLIFEDVIDRYRQLTKHFQELTKKELYCRLAARIPNLTIEAATGSEVNILKRNIANGGRGTSIRHIIDQIPNLLPKLCPCMLMSPISVAQFIDLNWPKFDLVIFDEASQMPTSEAIGAIGRGQALIVVGDNKQMPPTSFFATQQVDDEDAEVDDLDSILDDCQALSVPDHYLAFHYRSKHESLIAFSNEEYYDGRLYTFPSADDRVSKVSLVKVEGTYDKGGRRSNRAEAEAVVSEIIRRLADDELSKRSIGVVAFSVAQQNLIEDVLMEIISGKPEMERRAFSVEEPIFIKNLENVQGDERDVILFSIGYGPDKDGKVSMNFGPLNNRGGERRLNVAVSRARYEMVVFSTLRAEHIDLKRSTAAGVEGLRKFLKYAESSDNGLQESWRTEGASGDSASLPSSIAAALRELGYAATTDVGRSKFKVDVAVLDPKDPERYLLGLLIDGPSRLTAKIARDRELTQPSVLEGLGWRVLRVWSLDWTQRRQRVLETIVQAIENAGKPALPNEPLNLVPPRIIKETDAKSAAPRSRRAATAYDANNRPSADRTRTGTAAGTTRYAADIDTMPAPVIDKAILQVVNSQVSLPLDDLLLATNRQLGFQRRSKRIDAAIMRRVGALIVEKKVLRDGENIKSCS